MNSISPTTGDKLNATGVTTDSSYTYFGVTSNSYLNGVSYIRAANSTIASKVGLTSDILASGKTVLGVSGSLTNGCGSVIGVTLSLDQSTSKTVSALGTVIADEYQYYCPSCPSGTTLSVTCTKTPKLIVVMNTNGNYYHNIAWFPYLNIGFDPGSKFNSKPSTYSFGDVLRENTISSSGISSIRIVSDSYNKVYINRGTMSFGGTGTPIISISGLTVTFTANTDIKGGGSYSSSGTNYITLLTYY